MEEFYHTYNRGTEKRKIFLENRDYLRCIHDLFEFNNKNIVANIGRKFEGSRTPPNTPLNNDKKRDRLVDLFVWVLMPNHYHLFSSPVKDKGIPEFHRKFGGGFTNFFNIKYNRNGVLFQGGYKKILVDNDRQAMQLICYIHSNPLDLWKLNWKEKGLTNLEIKNALKFLEEYRWSSHLDWLGTKNFPSLIDSNFMFRFFKTSKEYREFFIDWLRYYAKDAESIKKLTLE